MSEPPRKFGPVRDGYSGDETTLFEYPGKRWILFIDPSNASAGKQHKVLTPGEAARWFLNNGMEVPASLYPHLPAVGQQPAPQSTEQIEPTTTTGTGAAAADSRRRMTRDEANEKAKQLARDDASFVRRPLREWAEAIGCSEGLVNKLPLWRATMNRMGRGRDKAPVPKAVGLTGTLEAGTGEGGRDEALNKLIADQEADREPSPLDDDRPGAPPRTVHSRKRL